MERFIKAQTMIDLFDRGLNPLPEAAQDEAVLVRCYQADRTRLEAYFTLYAIRVDRHEQRLFASRACRCTAREFRFERILLAALTGKIDHGRASSRIEKLRHARDDWREETPGIASLILGLG